MSDKISKYGVLAQRMYGLQCCWHWSGFEATDSAGDTTRNKNKDCSKLLLCGGSMYKWLPKNLAKP